MSETTESNDHLRRAVDAANLSTAEIAERLSVSVRSVQNWLAGERRPRRDERLRLALLLGVSRSELWPDVDDAHELSAVTEWPGLPGIPAERWRRLFTDAQEHIDIGAGSAQFLAQSLPDLRALLLAKAEVLHQDVQIRALFSIGEASAKRDEQETSNPDNPSPLAPGQSIATGEIGLKTWSMVLDGVPNAELRVIDNDEIWKRAIFRFDDVLLQYPYIPGRRGFASSVIEHRLVEVQGRFTDYMAGFDWMWERGQPPTL